MGVETATPGGHDRKGQEKRDERDGAGGKAEKTLMKMCLDGVELFLVRNGTVGGLREWHAQARGV